MCFSHPISWSKVPIKTAYLNISNIFTFRSAGKSGLSCLKKNFMEFLYFLVLI